MLDNFSYEIVNNQDQSNDETIDFADGNWELGILSEPSISYSGGSKKLSVNLILIDGILPISLTDDDIQVGLDDIEATDIPELDGLVVGVAMAQDGVIMRRHDIGQVIL